MSLQLTYIMLLLLPNKKKPKAQLFYITAIQEAVHVIQKKYASQTRNISLNTQSNNINNVIV